GAYLHRDPVNKRLRPRRGARLTAITCGGAIPDNADYSVVLEPSGHIIGTLNEDFAIESLPGDIFQLGNASWRILRIEAGRVRVEDAKGQPPSIPFWLGEAPGRTDELSRAVSRLRQAVGERLTGAPANPALTPSQCYPNSGEKSGGAALAWLVEQVGVGPAAAIQIVDYLAAARAALGVMPSHESLVLERFFDETGGMQLVVHSPLGSRLNRAWGLALRKRFCRKFNFELQAAATEDAIVLSLGQTHSFPLEEVPRYLHSASVRRVLTQALLDAPMFAVRWRWNAACALAVPRFRGGKKVPPQLQRIQAEDLLSVVFPDQLACLENIKGDREIPNHPLVSQTISDCLHDAMAIDDLEKLLLDLEAGRIHVHARDLTEPSPLAQEILNARPYAFLDDAPLEERRTQAVISRRWLDPATAADLGTLDLQAIERVKQEAAPEVQNADEMHDALVLLGTLTDTEVQPAWQSLLEALIQDSRITCMKLTEQPRIFWIAAERLPQLQALFPDAETAPLIKVPAEFVGSWSRERALVELVRGKLEGLGPTTSQSLAGYLGVAVAEIDNALATLESEGFALRGRFTPNADVEEWCERRLLARIHRYTISRLRKEIEPVSSVDYMRFLLSWQHLGSDQQLEGPQALLAVIEQLQGFEAPAAAWEGDILPARLTDYDPAWLDSLCLAGKVAWVRLTPPRNGQATERTTGPLRTTPITLLARKNLDPWYSLTSNVRIEQTKLTASAKRTAAHLIERGASFFDELVDNTGLLRAQVEEALAELVAWGLVSADSFSGLRALLVPSNRRRPLTGIKRRRKVAAFGIEDAGRWSLLRRRQAPSPAGRGSEQSNAHPTPAALEIIARALLQRYGVVCKRVLEREVALPPWRELLYVYRRLEARGDIRGGRFVAGLSGEQYALPEAVGTLREIRRQRGLGTFVSLSAADPLNLVGIITPGQRLAGLASNRVLYRDGLPVALQTGGVTQFLAKFDHADAWEARNALLRRSIATPLRPYRGKARSSISRQNTARDG
ncbi:MAG: ATP-dependent DNA helicase, partial [Gammaproteobacteria bacterium]|nr:ATP-dependent DNA helicase [Gammaproteobacteria bacterium]